MGISPTEDAGSGSGAAGQHAADETHLARRALAFFARNDVRIPVAGTLLGAIAIALFFGLGTWLLDRFRPDWQVAVQADQDRIQLHGRAVHGQYVIPRLSGNLKAPEAGTTSACEVTNAWAAGQRGVVADVMAVNVVLTKTTKADITIDNPDVIQAAGDQRAPLAGSLPACGRGGEPGVPVLYVDLYRDRSKTKWTFRDAADKPIDFSFDKKLVKFLVIARAHHCDCRRSLDLTTSRGDHNNVIHVSDDGRPFRTTSTEEAIPVALVSGRWQPAPTQSSATPSTAPSSGLAVPTFDACTLVDERVWGSALETPVTAIAPTGSGWSSARPLQGRPAVLSSNCNFLSTVENDRATSPSATVQAVVASSAAEAEAFAADYRRRQAAAPWHKVNGGAWVDDLGGLVAHHGRYAVVVFATSPDAPTTGASPQIKAAIDQAASQYGHALATP